MKSFISKQGIIMRVYPQEQISSFRIILAKIRSEARSWIDHWQKGDIIISALEFITITGMELPSCGVRRLCADGWHWTLVVFVNQEEKGIGCWEGSSPYSSSPCKLQFVPTSQNEASVCVLVSATASFLAFLSLLCQRRLLGGNCP